MFSVMFLLPKCFKFSCQFRKEEEIPEARSGK